MKKTYGMDAQMARELRREMYKAADADGRARLRGWDENTNYWYLGSRKFRSERELCKAYHMPVEYYRTMVEMGFRPQLIVSVYDPAEAQIPMKDRMVKYNGIYYATAHSLMKAITQKNLTQKRVYRLMISQNLTFAEAVLKAAATTRVKKVYTTRTPQFGYDAKTQIFVNPNTLKKDKSFTAMCRNAGMDNSYTVYMRIVNGMSLSDALTTPVRKYRRAK